MDTKVLKRRFLIPVNISITKSCEIEAVQEVYCDTDRYLNDLICTLCGEPVGVKRPLGIAWGKKDGDVKDRGLRLCNECYTLIPKIA